MTKDPHSKKLHLATNKIDIVEATIDKLLDALKHGVLTSVELVALYLARIGYYDRHGLRLNAVPILNPDVFNEARESDRRRAAGEPIRALEGIPFTVKDSYKVKGLSVASGSPAFQHLLANEDAASVALLKEAGAILIGKTTMPPMADGGMERGIYGRAESPYNPDYLTAAYASGSSNGSGTSTAASFAAFGMGEETLSSGRSPASNNGLIAYTPSRGLISIRGNWPLFPTCDVVVPHTRTMRDLFVLLDVLITDDPVTDGDFWRQQPHVSLPSPDSIRPNSYTSLANSNVLAGKRIGVPRMYIGKDEATRESIEVRASILESWYKAATILASLGATVIETDFPVVSNYDKDRPGTRNMYDRGLVPQAWQRIEMCDLIAYGWESFLHDNADPHCSSLANVDPQQIFPTFPGTIPDRESDLGPQAPIDDVVTASQTIGCLTDIPEIADALPGLELTRKLDFERWLDNNQLDFVAFPANADVGRADSDVNQTSNDDAWRNGVLFSNGNQAIRHLGIPSITVPMGTMQDINMPVGLTFIGKAYDDNQLLQAGYAFEQASQNRHAPALTPELEDIPQWVSNESFSSNNRPQRDIKLTATAQFGDISPEGLCPLTVSGTVAGQGPIELQITINGEPVLPKMDGSNWHAQSTLTVHAQPAQMVVDNPYWDIALIVIVARDRHGETCGRFIEVAPSTLEAD